MYIYILLKIEWTFWALPDSIKLHENQAENLSWNLVPRPISILCSPVCRPSQHATHLLPRDYVHTEYEVAGVSIKEVTARTQFWQQK